MPPKLRTLPDRLKSHNAIALYPIERRFQAGVRPPPLLTTIFVNNCPDGKSNRFILQQSCSERSKYRYCPGEQHKRWWRKMLNFEIRTGRIDNSELRLKKT